MRNGQDTRTMIIAKSAVLFNRQGYTGSSMSHIMDATGLQKGGIYRHFKNKDELALEAFDHAVEVLRAAFRAAVYGKRTAEEKLLSVFSVYMDVAHNPPLDGGCPLLNTAVDTDDTHQPLNSKAREAMNEWLSFIRAILKEGVRSNEFKDDLNIQDVSVFLTSAFEGAIMMGRLYSDNEFMKSYYRQVVQYIRCCVK
ncbi:TetR/AcrR family transcriptional regulator [Paenibacillus sp. NEAU-GSW1]|uniref:TetR/AcrR family transcriptional regulator n=1 Tax=Paenibacillus sp. NEAU-GSW1 TaxID=2682486 RepID=UPI0012E11AAB|nr:TetR/AcrR family transcriptional regulator [Paenibacillus sp. NEAU-GSW1]MUT65761.1 TetR family transcriptional regulator [Paenibacillus sp. NEAU-GSW1]